MRSSWRRLLLGLIPLLAVSAAAIYVERSVIENDLAERAKDALGDTVPWAHIAFDGRNVVLRGDAVLENEPIEAEATLRGVWGVRRVNNNAKLKPKIEPYVWSARRRGNRIRLHGYVPNKATRQTIMGIAKAALPGFEVDVRMHTGRGVPDQDTWTAGISFALKQLASLKRGEVSLENLAFSISGEAEDAAAYRELSEMLKRGLPKGITLASAKIKAPVVSPYTWSAQFAGGQLVLSGHVPGDAGERAKLLAAAATAPAGTDIVDRMEPAEGAPAGWTGVAAVLIKELVRLESGSVALKDTAITVGGVAADDAQAQAVRAAMRAAVAAPLKLTDHLRVREPPKVEPKAPEPPAPPAPTEVKPETKGETKPGGDDGQLKLASPAQPPKAEAPAAKADDAPKADPAPKVDSAPTTEAAPKADPAPKVDSALKVEAAPKVDSPPTTEAAPKADAAPKPDAAAKAQVGPAPPSVSTAPPAVVAQCRASLGKIARGGRILFDRGSAEIEGSSFKTLDRLAAAAKQCPGVRIAIEGHADIEGSTEYNQKLSVRRAEAVVAYLVKAGADASQLEALGFGSSRPAAPNKTASDRARNRRIEIVVRP
jgi:outer membrane protein OmpA-like peptidoglycan-associated protein